MKSAQQPPQLKRSTHVDAATSRKKSRNDDAMGADGESFDDLFFDMCEHEGLNPSSNAGLISFMDRALPKEQVGDQLQDLVRGPRLDHQSQSKNELVAEEASHTFLRALAYLFYIFVGCIQCAHPDCKQVAQHGDGGVPGQFCREHNLGSGCDGDQPRKSSSEECMLSDQKNDVILANDSYSSLFADYQRSPVKHFRVSCYGVGSFESLGKLLTLLKSLCHDRVFPLVPTPNIPKSFHTSNYDMNSRIIAPIIARIVLNAVFPSAKDPELDRKKKRESRYQLQLELEKRITSSKNGSYSDKQFKSDCPQHFIRIVGDHLTFSYLVWCVRFLNDCFQCCVVHRMTDEFINLLNNIEASQGENESRRFVTLFGALGFQLHVLAKLVVKRSVETTVSRKEHTTFYAAGTRNRVDLCSLYSDVKMPIVQELVKLICCVGFFPTFEVSSQLKKMSPEFCNILSSFGSTEFEQRIEVYLIEMYRRMGMNDKSAANTAVETLLTIRDTSSGGAGSNTFFELGLFLACYTGLLAKSVLHESYPKSPLQYNLIRQSCDSKMGQVVQMSKQTADGGQTIFIPRTYSLFSVTGDGNHHSVATSMCGVAQHVFDCASMNGSNGVEEKFFCFDNSITGGKCPQDMVDSLTAAVEFMSKQPSVFSQFCHGESTQKLLQAVTDFVDIHSSNASGEADTQFAAYAMFAEEQPGAAAPRINLNGNGSFSSEGVAALLQLGKGQSRSANEEAMLPTEQPALLDDDSDLYEPIPMSSKLASLKQLPSVDEVDGVGAAAPRINLNGNGSFSSEGVAALLQLGKGQSRSANEEAMLPTEQPALLGDDSDLYEPIPMSSKLASLKQLPSVDVVDGLGGVDELIASLVD
eukprot:scaffold3353_cov76-Skeletonema_dohrnii-CCMP3373.AAC.2